MWEIVDRLKDNSRMAGQLEFVGTPEISCFFILLIRFDSEKDDKCISLSQIRYNRVCRD